MRTFTRSFRYTFSLFGAVRQVFLLRPPASRSIPCTEKQWGSACHMQLVSSPLLAPVTLQGWLTYT